MKPDSVKIVVSLAESQITRLKGIAGKTLQEHISAAVEQFAERAVPSGKTYHPGRMQYVTVEIPKEAYQRLQRRYFRNPPFSDAIVAYLGQRRRKVGAA